MADDPQVPSDKPTRPPVASDQAATGAVGEPPKAEASGPEAPAAASTVPPTRPAAPPVPRPAPARPAAAPAAGAAEHKAAAPPAGPPDPSPPANVTAPAFVAAVQAAIPGGVTAVSYFVGDWTLIVPAARLLEVARHLRDSPDAAFDLCSDVTATDWPVRPARFDVVYCLFSTTHHHRVRVKVPAAEHEPVPSVTGLWPSANWLEREVWDMFGVNFTGHPDRRRILMPEDWQGHPQRKDYPLEGPGELLMENPLDWLKLRQVRDEAEIE